MMKTNMWTENHLKTATVHVVPMVMKMSFRKTMTYLLMGNHAKIIKYKVVETDFSWLELEQGVYADKEDGVAQTE